MNGIYGAVFFVEGAAIVNFDYSFVKTVMSKFSFFDFGRRPHKTIAMNSKAPSQWIALAFIDAWIAENVFLTSRTSFHQDIDVCPLVRVVVLSPQRVIFSRLCVHGCLEVMRIINYGLSQRLRDYQLKRTVGGSQSAYWSVPVSFKERAGSSDHLGHVGIERVFLLSRKKFSGA